MDDGKDADLVLRDPVDNNVGKAGDYQLACAVNPSGTAKVGVIRERIDGALIAV